MNPRFEIFRFAYHSKATLGVVKLDGVPRWFSLEDPDRIAAGLPKIAGRTAIPAGVYPIDIKPWSPRFKRAVPEIHGIPGFTDILIHIGNTHEDTAGCPLVGRSANLVGVPTISYSANAFAGFFAVLKKALARSGEQMIRIERGPISEGELASLRLTWTADAIEQTV